jgi:hypothetical protein
LLIAGRAQTSLRGHGNAVLGRGGEPPETAPPERITNRAGNGTACGRLTGRVRSTAQYRSTGRTGYQRPRYFTGITWLRAKS